MSIYTNITVRDVSKVLVKKTYDGASGLHRSIEIELTNGQVMEIDLFTGADDLKVEIE